MSDRGALDDVAVEVLEGGTEECVTPPKDLWKKLLKKESLSKSLLGRGYAIVKMDGFKEDVISLRNAQDNFFAHTDEEEKQRYNAGKIHAVSSYGYSLVDKLKEYYQVRVGGQGTKFEFASGKPDFGVIATKCYKHFDDLGRSILETLIKENDLDGNYIHKMLDPPSPHSDHEVKRGGKNNADVYTNMLPPGYPSSSNIDLFRYFNLDAFNDKWNSNHPAHVDSGLISIIPVSTIPGLEFEDQKLGGWIAIEKFVQDNDPANFESYAIVMIGEALALATKNVLRAGMHRVRRIPEATGPRYSTVFKMRSRPAITGPRYQQDYEVLTMQEEALKNSK
eukprot:TRINITY_DN8833_c0_g1_i1.p1 TRINITY_DN8833_c0_g1~~TRINITY_DN8833_c0_g1_i1.p1  ORF type:complete len:336 (-),score=71.18 TRINITY_DN8833_c0_g1_i1:90-1097(-)